METLARILLLLKKQGKQQKDLADFLCINKNNITDWKSGKSKSYTKYLYQIADYLNTTPEYLLGTTDEPRSPGAKNKLSESESELINAYRAHPEMHEAVNKLLGISDENNIRLVAAPKVTPPVIDLDSDEEKLT